MAKLFFRFAAMGGGKSAEAIQVDFNYREDGDKVFFIKSKIDENGGPRSVSRIGISRDVDLWIEPERSILNKFREIYDISEIEENYYFKVDFENKKNCEKQIEELDSIIYQSNKRLKKEVAFIIIDEAQFLSDVQVEELWYITQVLDIPVIAYGLKNDFQTNLFLGSKRLFELAEDIQMLTTNPVDHGRRAHFNARTVDGEFVLEGEQVALDGSRKDLKESKSNIGYTALSKANYFSKVLKGDIGKFEELRKNKEEKEIAKIKKLIKREGK